MVTLDLQIYQTKFTVKQLKKVKKRIAFSDKEKKLKIAFLEKILKNIFFREI